MVMPVVGVSGTSVPAHGSTSPGCESGWSHKYVMVEPFFNFVKSKYFSIASPFGYEISNRVRRKW